MLLCKTVEFLFGIFDFLNFDLNQVACDSSHNSTDQQGYENEGREFF